MSNAGERMGMYARKLQSSNKEYEIKVKGLEDTIQTLEGSIGDLQRQVTSYEITVSNLEGEVERLTSELEATKPVEGTGG